MTSAATLAAPPLPAPLPLPTTQHRPRVLFVGHDASSASIAAEVVRHVAGDAVRVETAETRPGEPGGRSDEMLVAMGLDPAGQHPLSAAALRTADRVVILGADVDVARLPGPRYEQWDLTREDLLTRVEALSDELTAGPEIPEPTTVGGRLRRRLDDLLAGLRRR